MRPKGTKLVNFNLSETLHSRLKDRCQHLGYTMSEMLTLLTCRMLAGEIYVEPTPTAWARLQRARTEQANDGDEAS